MCTDVYLQGSSVGNEKITCSFLPADVKAVSLAFSWETIVKIFAVAIWLVTGQGGKNTK